MNYMIKHDTLEDTLYKFKKCFIQWEVKTDKIIVNGCNFPTSNEIFSFVLTIYLKKNNTVSFLKQGKNQEKAIILIDFIIGNL